MSSDPPIPPPPRAARVRPTSSDSFPALAPDDRKLLQSVLEAAMEATKSNKALTTKVKDNADRISIVEGDVREIKGMAGMVGSLGEGVNGMRADIQNLNKNVMENIQGDAERERRMGDLRHEVLALSQNVAKDAAKAPALRWGAGAGIGGSFIVTLVWLVVYLIATLRGAPTPPAPKHLNAPAPESAPPR